MPVSRASSPSSSPCGWRDGRPVKAFDDDPLPGEGVRSRRQAFGYDTEYTIDAMGFLGELIDTSTSLAGD